MKLHAQAVRDALAAHVSLVLAEKLKLPPELEDRDLGAALLRGVTLEPPGEADLRYVLVTCAAEGIGHTLDPSDVARHPLLQRWLPASLADALSGPFVMGAQALDRMIWTPRFANLQVVDQDGDLGGVVELAWTASEAEWRATAVYGSVATNPTCARYTTLGGPALVAAGAEAARLRQEHPRTATNRWRVAGRVLH